MGVGEILVVLFIALIFLGPERIPSTARTLGKWFHEIKNSLDGVRDAFEKDLKEDPKGREKEESSPSNPKPPALP